MIFMIVSSMVVRSQVKMLNLIGSDLVTQNNEFEPFSHQYPLRLEACGN